MTGERLIDLLREAELTPRSYSGRAMYGARCVSVTVAPLEALAVGAALALAAVAEAGEGDEHAEAEEVYNLMAAAREDSMGRDVVVYWPDVEWPEDAGEEDDDNDD